MKTSYALVTVIALMGTVIVALGTALAAATIDITDIQQDIVILGKVSGLKGPLNNYKVLVYVKTDRWYIHPFASGGPGKSYAEIHDDGTWEIQTVLRYHPASSVAAVVVARDYPAPSTTGSIGKIKARAKVILNKKELKAKDFLGKL